MTTATRRENSAKATQWNPGVQAESLQQRLAPKSGGYDVRCSSMDAVFNGTVPDMRLHSSFRAHNFDLTQGPFCSYGRRLTGGSRELIYGMGWTQEHSTIARANADIRVQGRTIWAVLYSVRKPHCLGHTNEKTERQDPQWSGRKWPRIEATVYRRAYLL
jgi:hypothetical protein